MLHGLVPKDVFRTHEDEIYEVMDELAGIVELNGSSWSQFHSESIVRTYISIRALNFEHGYFGSKLRALGRTLPFPDYIQNPFNTDPRLQLSLHSC